MPNFYNFLCIDYLIICYSILWGYILYYELNPNKFNYNTKLCDYVKHFLLKEKKKEAFLKPVSDLYKEALTFSSEKPHSHHHSDNV